MRFFPETNFDFVGKKNIFITLSILLIASGLVSMWLKGGLSKGVEFTGGTVIQLKFAVPQQISELRNALDKANIKNAVIQESGKGIFLIRIGFFETESETKLRNAFKDIEYEVLSVEGIGPQVSKELQKKALLAIIIATIGILIYVGYRFKPVWGLAAIIALIHDVLVTLGFCSIFNKDISLTIIAAFLTLIGYSVNDTIVNFDRMRENLKLKKGLKFSQIINFSSNQMLSRTTLTVLTSLFVAISLFFFGGSVIHDFAFVLVIGLLTGTYSSIFIAAPIILFFEKE